MKRPFVIPDEMARLLEEPASLKLEVGSRLRVLYQETAEQFSPFRDLSDFAKYCFFGDYEGMVKEYNRVKPNIRGSETPYRWGYVSLASNGSRIYPKRTPFSSYIPTLFFLIGSGAPVDLRDIAGLTALHHVSMNNRVGEVLQILLAAGANPNLRDCYGTTPLHYAVQYNQAEAVEMCMKHDGDIHIPDNDGYSPFYLIRYNHPTLHAIVHKYLRLKDGVTAPMEEKQKCSNCGKMGSKSQCARCRVVRYCSPECQVTHWKNGHKASCVPFNSVETTMVCKPTFRRDGEFIKGQNMGSILRNAHGMEDEEAQRREDEKLMAARGLKGPNTSQPPKAHKQLKFIPFRSSMLGKSMIVKLQVPVVYRDGPLPSFYMKGMGEILVYNKSRDFVCTIHEQHQSEVYARLEAVVRAKGSVGGLKGYFVAELESKDRLKIKTGEILADQPW